ncbi:MAG: sulfur carrier protein ThiS [Pseudomonadota bacterium]
MQIILNGKATETKAQTLAHLCEELGVADAKIATAKNGDFVAKTARHTTLLAINDRVEIVAPRQGG